jgi:hypothetical protein
MVLPFFTVLDFKTVFATVVFTFKTNTSLHGEDMNSTLQTLESQDLESLPTDTLISHANTLCKAISAKERPEILRRHLKMSKLLEEAIIKKLEPARMKDGTFRDKHFTTSEMRALSQAMKAITDVSARAAGFDQMSSFANNLGDTSPENMKKMFLVGVMPMQAQEPKFIDVEEVLPKRKKPF